MRSSSAARGVSGDSISPALTDQVRAAMSRFFADYDHLRVDPAAFAAHLTVLRADPAAVAQQHKIEMDALIKKHEADIAQREAEWQALTDEKTVEANNERQNSLRRLRDELNQMHQQETKTLQEQLQAQQTTNTEFRPPGGVYIRK